MQLTRHGNLWVKSADYYALPMSQRPGLLIWFIKVVCTELIFLLSTSLIHCAGSPSWGEDISRAIVKAGLDFSSSSAFQSSSKPLTSIALRHWRKNAKENWPRLILFVSCLGFSSTPRASRLLARCLYLMRFRYIKSFSSCEASLLQGSFTCFRSSPESLPSLIGVMHQYQCT